MRNAGMNITMDADGQSGGIAAKKAGLGLGYFSIALGLLEVAAPGRLARLLGVENDTARNTIFAFGLRELLAGGALLRGPAVSTNVWNRVIGDLLDAGALRLAARSSGSKRSIAFAGGVVAGAFVADVLTARALDRDTGRTFPVLSRDQGPPPEPPEDPVSEPEFTPEPHDFAAA
jgi:hypothetical protein